MCQEIEANIRNLKIFPQRRNIRNPYSQKNMLGLNVPEAKLIVKQSFSVWSLHCGWQHGTSYFWKQRSALKKLHLFLQDFCSTFYWHIFGVNSWLSCFIFFLVAMESVNSLVMPDYLSDVNSVAEINSLMNIDTSAHPK